MKEDPKNIQEDKNEDIAKDILKDYNEDKFDNTKKVATILEALKDS